MSNFNEAIQYLQLRDTILCKIIEEIGECTLEPEKDYFHSLLRSILSQQLATKAADTIYNRFIIQLNKEITPAKVLKLKDQQFRLAGISQRKQSYLIDLATKFENDTIDLSHVSILDNEKIIEELTKVKGIGRWTAEMFLIFALNRLDVLPLDDLGFKRGMMLNYNLKIIPNEKKIISISNKWKPYRSIGTWYMWQSLDNQND